MPLSKKANCCPFFLVWFCIKKALLERKLPIFCCPDLLPPTQSRLLKWLLGKFHFKLPNQNPKPNPNPNLLNITGIDNTLESRINEQVIYWKMRKNATYTHLFRPIRLLILGKKSHLYVYSHIKEVFPTILLLIFVLSLSNSIFLLKLFYGPL